MRVFVVGTGRCGSSTFYQACKTISNYTCGHETFVGKVHDFKYPDNHIEVAVQNMQALAYLRREYPNSKFVHLIRERESCIQSLYKQVPEYLSAWAFQMFLLNYRRPSIEIAEWYYDITVNAIRGFSRSICQQDYIEIPTYQMDADWGCFCKQIRADCNFEEAYKILKRKYNPGCNRGRDNYVEV